MAMMDVRVVRMPVSQQPMLVRVRMRLGAVPLEGVLMLVMLVVTMPVAMVERLRACGHARVAPAGAARCPAPISAAAAQNSRLGGSGQSASEIMTPNRGATEK